MCGPIHTFGGVCVRKSSLACLFRSPGDGIAGITKVCGVDCWRVLADVDTERGKQISRKLVAVVG